VKRFGLPKTCILRKPREFLQVYQQGRRLKGNGFSLIFLANDLERSRLGISIHRMFRGSVRRNRTKRVVREVFRLHRDIFPPASDIVVTVAPHFRFLSYHAFRQAVAGLTCPDRAE
jgi:ribonuclease P protein component